MSKKSRHTNKPSDFFQNLTWKRILGWSLSIAIGVPLIINVFIRVGNWIFSRTGYNMSALDLGNTEWFLFYGSFLGGLFTLCAVFFTLKQNAKQNTESRELQIHTLISQFDEKELSHTKELVANAVNSLDTVLISALREQINTETDFSLIKSESLKLYAKQKEAFNNLYLLTDINHDRTPCRDCKDCKTPSYAEYIEAADEFNKCLGESAGKFASTLNDFMKSIDMASFKLWNVKEIDMHQNIVIHCNGMIESYESMLQTANNEDQFQEVKIDLAKRIAERDAHMIRINEINKSMIENHIIGEQTEKVNRGIVEINEKLASELFLSAKKYLSYKENVLYYRTKMARNFDSVDSGCKKYQEYIESKAKETAQADTTTEDVK